MPTIVTSYAESSTPGRARIMEDTSVVVPDFRGSPTEFFAAIYDGHYGRAVADIAQENLHGELEKAMGQTPDLGTAMTMAFLATDRIVAEKEKEKAAQSYRGANLGGAVAVVAYIHEPTLVVANVGDAHAVLDRNGRAERLSCAHGASDPQEAQRIRRAGGQISRYENDVARVRGELAVTRALGDIRLKDWVISQPFIAKVVLRPGDERLILGCDGLWDWMTDQYAIDLLRESQITDAAAATEILQKEAFARGSDDNITVIVVSLNP